jgi:hypothetical protein
MLCSGAAFAQEAPTPQAPVQPAPASSEPPAICTDRPTKANSTCTVPKGDWQVESDLVNWTNSSIDGVSADLIVAPNPTLKYGVSKNVDIEVNWAPYQQLTVKAGGVSTRSSGSGDVFVRLKWEPINNSKWSLAVIPYVKAPAAPHTIGNGRVEGGLIVPVTFTLPDKFSLTFGPELDALENAALDGHHVNLINLINLSRPVTGKLTLYAEVWNDQNFDPLGTVSQTTADVAAAYLVNNTFQLDVGGNFGVSHFAPRTQLYVGVSKRF